MGSTVSIGCGVGERSKPTSLTSTPSIMYTSVWLVLLVSLTHVAFGATGASFIRSSKAAFHRA